MYQVKVQMLAAKATILIHHPWRRRKIGRTRYLRDPLSTQVPRYLPRYLPVRQVLYFMEHIKIWSLKIYTKYYLLVPTHLGTVETYLGAYPDCHQTKYPDRQVGTYLSTSFGGYRTEGTVLGTHCPELKSIGTYLSDCLMFLQI